MADKPYEFVRRQMALGSQEISYLSQLLKRTNGNPDPEEEHVTKWSSASLYAGGADTVSIAPQPLVLSLDDDITD